MVTGGRRGLFPHPPAAVPPPRFSPGEDPSGSGSSPSKVPSTETVWQS